MSTLSNPVLVLNRSWHACSVVSTRRAITLVYKKDAEIILGKMHQGVPIDPEYWFSKFTWDDWSKLKPHDGEKLIQGPDSSWRAPEVIKLLNHDKPPFDRMNFSRRQLWKRDNNTCQYCGCRPGTGELTIDHVLPKSHGGKTTWENCVVACIKCNSLKANRTPQQARMKFYHQDYRPSKPKFTLFKGDLRIDSWKDFLDEAYWNVTLDNDM
jgi:5-methylcytosine-specific restriction endonuclease McrA